MVWEVGEGDAEGKSDCAYRRSQSRSQGKLYIVSCSFGWLIYVQSYAIEIQASELDDLDEAAVRVLIQKAGGANCKWLERCASL